MTTTVVASEDCTALGNHGAEDDSTKAAVNVELARADQLSWVGIFTAGMLEDQLNLEWDDVGDEQATQTILIVNHGVDGEAGLIMTLLARRDFKFGRVVVAVPSDRSTTRAIAMAQKMGATDVIVLQSDEGSNVRCIQSQLEEIGITEVEYTAVCYSSTKYTGPYVSGTRDGEIGASGGGCGRLPALSQLDSLLHRLTTLWDAMSRNEQCGTNFGDDNAQDRILRAIAKSYPDDDHWSRLLNLGPEKLELKTIMLAQKEGQEYCQMQIVVGENKYSEG